MNYVEKLRLIITEYVLSPVNHHLLTCTGGNIEHYMFIAEKKIVSSSDVDSILINENLICNQEYIDKTSPKEIRNLLDKKISEAIAETNFKSPSWIDGKTGIDIKDISDIDLEKDCLVTRMIIAQQKCAEFKKILESEQATEESYKTLVDFLSSIEMPVALFAIRTQISIEVIIRFGLDEHDILGPFLVNMNKRLDGLYEE